MSTPVLVGEAAEVALSLADQAVRRSVALGDLLTENADARIARRSKRRLANMHLREQRRLMRARVRRARRRTRGR